MSMEIPIPGSDLVNPLASQFGHLSLQDKAFLDAFNRQEQQELHGVPRPGPVDSNTLLGQLEQVTSQITHQQSQGSKFSLQRQGSVQSSTSSSHTNDGSATSGGGASGQGVSGPMPRHHEVVEELAPEEIRWFYKREVDKDWTPFMGYDSLRIELRYRHIWQTKWSEVDRRTNTMSMDPRGPRSGRGPRGRRAQSLNRVHYGNGMDEDDYEDETKDIRYKDDFALTHGSSGSMPGYYASSPSAARQGLATRGRHRSNRHYRSADNFMEDDRDMHVVVRGGVYEVDLAEWKCHSIYWPGEAFDLLRGTWFYEDKFQPVQCEYADRIEQEHLQRFLGHKMASYIWDSSTSTRLEKQVHHTTSFPEFHVDWMSPEEVYLHRENASSQIYRGISASLGFKKPTGCRLFRGYKDLCQHSDRLPDITHIVFVVHGVGQVVDDTTIIRNTNTMRDNVTNLLNKQFPNLQKETGQRVEFFPVEWRSSLRLDEGMVKHITPQRIMGLRNMLNSSAMDIMYYTSPLFRMEIWQTLQEELNRLYEMFVQRNPYFEANGGKVSIAAHSLGCVVTYDILTGWTQEVEHSWHNLQTRGGGVQDLKRSRRFRAPGGGSVNPGGSNQAPSGLLFRIENLFCLGSPLSVFLSLRWRDPTNQEYHDHILPRSLCKYLYNVYHPCDPVAYRVEPIFMKFYSKIEPVHLYGVGDPCRIPYAEVPLQPLQNARKADESSSESSSGSMLPVNIANGAINISVGKMIPSQLPAMSPSISLPKMPNVPGLGGSLSSLTSNSGNASGGSGTTTVTNTVLNGAGGAMNQVGQAAGGLFGGVLGMVKDAAAAVTPGSGEGSNTSGSATKPSHPTTVKPGMPPVLPSSRGAGQPLTHKGNIFSRSLSMSASATTTTSAGFIKSSNAHSTLTSSASVCQQNPPVSASASAAPQPPAASVPQVEEVKLPDGQRLAYRMDYILRETGNTYIAAVTSHTSYWSNPDVAYFMLVKLYPEAEYCKKERQVNINPNPQTQHVSQQQQQQQQPMLPQQPQHPQNMQQQQQQPIMPQHHILPNAGHQPVPPPPAPLQHPSVQHHHPSAVPPHHYHHPTYNHHPHRQISPQPQYHPR